MSVQPLNLSQPITQKGDKPSRDLVEIIQRLVDKIDELETRVTALEP